MFRFTHDNKLQNLNRFFTNFSTIHHGLTRLSNANLYYISLTIELQNYKKALKYQGFKIWNSLPNFLKQKMSLNLFKK